MNQEDLARHDLRRTDLLPAFVEEVPPPDLAAALLGEVAEFADTRRAEFLTPGRRLGMPFDGPSCWPPSWRTPDCSGGRAGSAVQAELQSITSRFTDLGMARTRMNTLPFRRLTGKTVFSIIPAARGMLV